MDLKFKIGTTSQINNTEIDEGSFLVDKEKGQILIDTDEKKRIAISGGVGESVAHWEKLLDIAIDEEVNSIILTSDKMPQCKEFIVRAIFPVSTTGETVSLGAAYCYLNNNIGAFRFTATDINKSVITEQRCHILIADDLIYSIGTEGAYGQAAIVANVNTIVGNRVITDNVTQIIYKLIDSTKSYQIGTQFQVYGKVEK